MFLAVQKSIDISIVETELRTYVSMDGRGKRKKKQEKREGRRKKRKRAKEIRLLRKCEEKDYSNLARPPASTSPFSPPSPLYSSSLSFSLVMVRIALKRPKWQSSIVL